MTSKKICDFINLSTLSCILLVHLDKVSFVCDIAELWLNRKQKFLFCISAACEQTGEIWSQHIGAMAMQKVCFIFQAARWLIEKKNLWLRSQCPGINEYVIFDLLRIQYKQLYRRVFCYLIFLGSASILILKLEFSLFSIVLQ